ncbi:RNAse P Rpr2/Rpp21/SNM1 subunit domain-containing protein [Lasiosphaeris hirsuta]|uniref:RNAse P Rpr2/Rpp21/SNM1 subunit domain-containing protein n=1 Tax=Lasiosphaeris hirsuta TaxID=260670 RepID=A0AA40E993_9PEZI|nr:RNAse P Rpr2/Rpp21/SNM1 subunit domain-containing protein [Lasiosphaeris hirsuta]
MAKGKPNGGVQNRAIYSRVSFLHQAAAFLSSSSPRQVRLPQQPPRNSNECNATAAPGSATATTTAAAEGMARCLATDLRSVSLKTRIRLTPDMKQTMCKFCDSILIEGQSVTSTVENRSRGGRKSWADVLVRKCHACGRERRYPVSAARPKRKGER